MNPINVIILLQKKFPSEPNYAPISFTLEERNMADHLAEILIDCHKTNTEIEIENILETDHLAELNEEFDEDELWDLLEENDSEQSDDDDAPEKGKQKIGFFVNLMKN